MQEYSICIVSQQFKSIISGVGLHTRNLVTGLRQDNHKVTLITPITQYEDASLNGIRVITVPAPPFQQSQARWIPLAWFFAKALRQLQTDSFDLIHFTDAREALLSVGCHNAIVGNANDYYAAQLRPISYYRRYYFDATRRWLYYLIVQTCERITFHRLNAVIANSEYTRQAVQRAYSLDSRRLFKCFKCLDPDLLMRPCRTDYDQGPVLFVGGNMQRKGLVTLIQASVYVIAKYPNSRFVVVGSDPNLPKMKALCHKLGVEDYFDFRGWIPHKELRDLYYNASAFVMPSLDEAFGMALLEAMAAGTPVISACVGGIPEFVHHGENGLLVEAGSPEELSRALLSVISDRNLAAFLGRNGYQTARQFGLEQMMACTYRVYDLVLDK